MDTSQKVILNCLQLILRPAMRFCLKYNLHIQDILEAVKVMFISVCEEEMKKSDEPVNVSRLSAMTGMHRREVTRIFRERTVVEEPRGLINRIIGRWQHDSRFTTKSGKPRILSIGQENSEFKKLVKYISNDINHGTVLFELERIGAVERVKDGLKLISKVYVPKGNIKEGFELLASDTEDLMACVEHNLFHSNEIPNLHGKTEYDNISVDSLPKIRTWLVKEGTAFHRKVRKFLSQFDRDVNVRLGQKQAGARVALGTFSIVDSNSHD